MKKAAKKLYNLIPFKQQFYSMLRLCWKPPQHLYQHFHFKGVFLVAIDQARFFKIRHYGFQVENELFWSGLKNGWEKQSINVWIRLCEQAEVVFDIGANTGVYALIAKTMNSNARVYAFEPVARVFEKLQANIGLNQFDIVSVEKAVSDFDGTALIYDTDSEHTYSVTVNKNMHTLGTKVNEIKIETVKLNTFIKEHAITKIDLMKIDVEAHEPEVLAGFSDYLNKYTPTMLIEVLSDEVGSKVEHLVKEAGYLYFNIDELAGIRQTQHITKSDYYNYVLCSRDVAVRIGLIA